MSRAKRDVKGYFLPASAALQGGRREGRRGVERGGGGGGGRRRERGSREREGEAEQCQ